MHDVLRNATGGRCLLSLRTSSLWGLKTVHMSSSPQSPFVPSVHGLVAQFDNIHLSHPPQAGFIGVSGTNKDNKSEREKSLPPTPSDASDYPNNIPLSLRPGYAQEQSKLRPQRQNSQSPRSQATMPAIQMPIPMLSLPSLDQSLTMMFARSAPPTWNNFPSLPMPQPDNLGPSYLRHQSHSSVPTTTTSSPPATPKTKAHIRPSSTPSSPSSFADSHNPLIQCHGTTKAGKRCTRLVKAPPLVSFFAPTASEPVQRFCFQHTKEVLSPSGFYSHKEGGGWVDFADWIPNYLHSDTQAILRVEMEKPASSKDEPGYIYAYEIRDDRVPTEIKIKVGRAVKLVKRLDQWSKQCTSKEVILRGWWPGTVEDDDGTNGTSLLRGRIKAGEKGPNCHRLERLVHLELADLSVYAPYLEPGFPNTNSKAETSGSSSAPATPGCSPKPSKVRMPSAAPCVDCGAVHKEIFAFQRVRKGMYKNAEWERLVEPVIAKWGRFVEKYV